MNRQIGRLLDRFYRIGILVLVIGILILATLYLTWHPEPVNQEVPALSQVEITPDMGTPFDTIYYYYEAVEQGDWDRVRELSTPTFFNFLQRSGFMKRWEMKIRSDPTIRFVMFLVTFSKNDAPNGRAWATGKVDWASSRQRIPNFMQTVHLEQDPASGRWLVAKIDTQQAAETVDNFYETIDAADWVSMRRLTTYRYWRQLEAAGVLPALLKERGGNQEPVYVVFFLEDFAESRDQAWVEGTASWRPLSPEARETPVKVKLLKIKNQWQIDQIIGHWKLAK